jgi:hypothetical protein
MTTIEARNDKSTATVLMKHKKYFHSYEMFHFQMFHFQRMILKTKQNVLSSCNGFRKKNAFLMFQRKPNSNVSFLCRKKCKKLALCGVQKTMFERCSMFQKRMLRVAKVL